MACNVTTGQSLLQNGEVCVENSLPVCDCCIIILCNCVITYVNYIFVNMLIVPAVQNLGKELHMTLICQIE
jgi:hypothetical protein